MRGVLPQKDSELSNVFLIADSICGGFGQRSQKSFVHFSLEILKLNLHDVSKSGMCSQVALQRIQEIDVLDEVTSNDLVIISIGNVDAKPVYMRNNIWADAVPRRYRKEKIDPRPYYSTKPSKRLFELADNVVRSLCRRFCYITGNYQRKISQEKFERNFIDILDIFSQKTKNFIIILPSKIEDGLFPGASSQFNDTRLFLNNLCKDRNLGSFDFTALVEDSDYLLDRFHLNESGHQKIVSHFSKCLKSVL